MLFIILTVDTEDLNTPFFKGKYKNSIIFVENLKCFSIEQEFKIKFRAEHIPDLDFVHKIEKSFRTLGVDLEH